MFYITVVLYNKKPDDIASLDTIRRFIREKSTIDSEIIIVDNSDSKYIDKMKKSEISAPSEDSDSIIYESGVSYITNGKNLGLSKAFNASIKHALVKCDNPKEAFMLFLDDDTDISYEYVCKIYDEYNVVKGDDNKDHINVLTGLISSANVPMSPMKEYKLKFGKTDYITEPGVYDDIICINSGMAVRLSCLEITGGFSEELFLDMMDFLLLYNLSQRGLCRVKVLDQRIDQNFSGRGNRDKKYLLRRYEIYKKDFSKYCELTGRSSMFRRAGLLKRRIAIEYKSGVNGE